MNLHLLFIYYLVNSSYNNYSFVLYKIYPSQYDKRYCYYYKQKYDFYFLFSDKCERYYCSNRNKRIKANINIKTISKIENINR